MITSTGNATIKHISQLLKKRSLRNEEGVFVIEGLRSFREIPKDRLVKAYISETAAKESDYSYFKGMPHEIVSDAVMSYLSDTKTSQGYLAVVRQSDKSEISWKSDGLYLILEHIQDPGNLGTILRLSEAAGVTHIIMSTDTVDIYNPKVVRATMGAVFRVPFSYTEDLTGCIRNMKKAGVNVYGAALKNSQDYATLDYTLGCAFVIGNEANGLTEETLKICDSYVKIPMEGQVESLNAAVAAAVLSFEAYRQRRIK